MTETDTPRTDTTGTDATPTATPGAAADLDARVAELSQRHLDLAVTILREAIRIPADHVDLPTDAGGDPASGLSNHEGPRLEYLRQTIIDIGAVRDADDVWFDDYGNLV